jgi:hypothetical protein
MTKWWSRICSGTIASSDAHDRQHHRRGALWLGDDDDCTGAVITVLAGGTRCSGRRSAVDGL